MKGFLAIEEWLFTSNNLKLANILFILHMHEESRLCFIMWDFMWSWWFNSFDTLGSSDWLIIQNLSDFKDFTVTLVLQVSCCGVRCLSLQSPDSLHPQRGNKLTFRLRFSWSQRHFNPYWSLQKHLEQQNYIVSVSLYPQCNALLCINCNHQMEQGQMEVGWSRCRRT